LIEFITLSKDPVAVAALRRSIHLTCVDETPWNLTVIDGERFDLFKGYNNGIAQTKGDILAFIHDDAKLLGNFLTLAKPLELLRESSTGFIGVAGSQIINLSTGIWWGTDNEKLNSRGLIYQFETSQPFGTVGVSWPNSAYFGGAVVVDGVFMMCHRSTVEELGGFDEKTYEGFHFYDVDICYRAHIAGMKNYVAPIPLLHRSKGCYDEKWEKNRQLFVKKFNHAASNVAR
jgi:GT2 family glycosyltransferase